MTMTRPPSAVTERAGVFAAGRIVNEFGWVFREQTTDDYGIDAQAEVFESGGIATGKLIALQIKSGRTKYFANKKANGWTHYVDSRHAEYWLKHSLPVIVVLYDELIKRPPGNGSLVWPHRDGLIRPQRVCGSQL